MSIKEDIIKYINNNYQNRITNDAYIYLYLSDLEKLGYTKNAIIKELNILSSEQLIKINIQPPNPTFDIPWKITPMDKCLNYFKEQHHNNRIENRDNINIYMTIFISIISVIIALITLIKK